MIPTIDLHCHLDCSMRLGTIEELAAAAGLDYPRPISELATVPEDCQSLTEFLTAVEVEVDVLQSLEAIERAAFELVEDFHADGVIHGEIRFAPHLHRRNGDRIDDIIDAAAQGAQRGADQTGISTSLIVCALRHRDPAEGPELLDAVRRLPGRVAGVDLAGPEAGFPAAPFRSFFAGAAAAGLGITIHAGEAAGADSVREAVRLGASRVGHGVRSIDDPDLVDLLAARNVTLECCPRSNVLTGAVATIEQHPIDELHTRGVPTTVNTDTRTCVPTTLHDEIELLTDVFGWDTARLISAELAAADAAFVDPDRRAELKQQIHAAGGS